MVRRVAGLVRNGVIWRSFSALVQQHHTYLPAQSELLPLKETHRSTIRVLKLGKPDMGAHLHPVIEPRGIAKGWYSHVYLPDNAIKMAQFITFGQAVLAYERLQMV